MPSTPIPSRVLTLSGAALYQPDLPPLEAVALSGDEAVNALFDYRLSVQTREREPDYAPWSVDAALVLGQPLTLHLELEGRGAGERQISGVIAEVIQGDSDARHHRLELVIRPGLFEATLAVHSHPFQDMTVVEVLDAVLAHYAWPVDKRLVATYPSVDLTTQYQETDWHFICRLMQNAGINYHFEHVEGTHRLILSDHNSAFKPFGPEDGSYHQIPIHPPGHRIDREYIHAFAPIQRITSTSWEARDHDYTRPRLVRVARGGEASSEDTHTPREISVWRAHQSGAGGLWSQPNADRDAQANAKADDSPRHLSRIRLEALTQRQQRASGEGHIRGIAAGHTFHLEGHQQESANTEHLVLATRITVQAPGQESQGSDSDTGAGHWRIHTAFETQPASLALRPDLVLAKPHISGPETAVVTGPQGSNLHTDHLGRIKVRMLWDRSGRMDHTSSIWMRHVAPSAGNQLGAVFLPRLGQEVLVQFEGGDPDRPIATHSVYNGANTPPWQLPGQHALSGFRSRELTEGGGNAAMGRSNHFISDDSAGQIQVQVKSDHQHSSLSVGSVTRIEDNAGRKDARGEGAELRTDGHAVLRAAAGIIVTTTARLAAQGGMKEINEAARRLEQALEQQEQIADAAVQHSAQEGSDQKDVALRMKEQAAQLRGTGEKLGELSQPHLLLDSAAGIQSTATTSTQQASGHHHAIVAGGHVSVSGGKSLLASATQSVRLFARKAGMRLFAAEKKIEVQAQAGSVEIVARDTIRLSARDIDLQATELVLINGDGSHTRLVRAGITHATDGGWTVHSGDRNHTKPKSLPVEPPDLPEIPPYDEQFRAVNLTRGQPVAGVPFVAELHTGQAREGFTDRDGRTPRFHGSAPSAVQITWGGLQEEPDLPDDPRGEHAC